METETIRIKPETYQKAKRIADEQGITVSEVLERAAIKAIEELEKAQPEKENKQPGTILIKS